MSIEHSSTGDCCGGTGDGVNGRVSGEGTRPYVPALGLRWLTPLYDGLMCLGGRERTFKTRLLDQAAIQPEDAVLDLGCGTGTLAVWLKQQVPGAEVVGIDGDGEVLARARAKALDAGLSLRFDQGLSWDLPYRSGSFDVVLSTLFFHHLDRPGRRQTLIEVGRVLRPGGWLHVADWGRQESAPMRALSLPDRLLDGFERTADNFAGRLPRLMQEAGFAAVSENGGLNTAFGRLTFYAARNPS